MKLPILFVMWTTIIQTEWTNSLVFLTNHYCWTYTFIVTSKPVTVTSKSDFELVWPIVMVLHIMNNKIGCFNQFVLRVEVIISKVDTYAVFKKLFISVMKLTSVYLLINESHHCINTITPRHSKTKMDTTFKNKIQP